MSIARCLAVLILAAVIGGCASVAGGARVTAESAPIEAADEVALLRLAEKVEDAALAQESADLAR